MTEQEIISNYMAKLGSKSTPAKRKASRENGSAPKKKKRAKVHAKEPHAIIPQKRSPRYPSRKT